MSWRNVIRKQDTVRAGQTRHSKKMGFLHSPEDAPTLASKGAQDPIIDRGGILRVKHGRMCLSVSLLHPSCEQILTFIAFV